MWSVFQGSKQSLKEMRRLTGNQWRSRRMSSKLTVQGARAITHAKMFCTCCSLLMFACDILYSTLLYKFIRLLYLLLLRIYTKYETCLSCTVSFITGILKWILCNSNQHMNILIVVSWYDHFFFCSAAFSVANNNRHVSLIRRLMSVDHKH